jgi:hypothetical protein
MKKMYHEVEGYDVQHEYNQLMFEIRNRVPCPQSKVKART